MVFAAIHLATQTKHFSSEMCKLSVNIDHLNCIMNILNDCMHKTAENVMNIILKW